MKGKPVQNLAASVYARLLKRTEPGDEQFQFVLMRYGAERLMYRLSQSEHAANFVLKGAMMFLVWTGAQYRATKDMDLLALKSASVERLRDILEEIGHSRASYRWRCNPIFSKGSGLNPGRRLNTGASRRRR